MWNLLIAPKFSEEIWYSCNAFSASVNHLIHRSRPDRVAQSAILLPCRTDCQSGKSLSPWLARCFFGQQRRKLLQRPFFEGFFVYLTGSNIFALHFKESVMYAIVDIAGKQFKVSKDQYIYAPRIEGEAGVSLNFDKVLLIDNGGTVEVGTPTVKGARVSGKILEHVKGNKVIIFKKKRRKGYAVKNGHRQQFTKVLIEEIGK